MENCVNTKLQKKDSAMRACQMLLFDLSGQVHWLHRLKADTSIMPRNKVGLR